MLHEMGLQTGIDLASLIPIREVLKQGLPGEPLYGYVAGVGLDKCAGEAKAASAR
jgi:hydroxymethylglutaryl-CoA lyase